EVRKGDDTTPRACCPNSAARGAGGACARVQAATERRPTHDPDLISRDLFSAAPLHLCSATSGGDGALSGGTMQLDPKRLRWLHPRAASRPCANVMSLSPDRAWLATGKNSQLCLSATGDQH